MLFSCFSLVFSCISYIVFNVLISCYILFMSIVGFIFLTDSSFKNNTCPLDSGLILLFLDIVVEVCLSAQVIIFLLTRSTTFFRVSCMLNLAFRTS